MADLQSGLVRHPGRGQVRAIGEAGHVRQQSLARRQPVDPPWPVAPCLHAAHDGRAARSRVAPTGSGRRRSAATSSASGSTTEPARTATSAAASGPPEAGRCPRWNDQVRHGERQVGQQRHDHQAPLRPDRGGGQDDGQAERGAAEVPEEVLAERRGGVDRRHVGVEARREQQRPQSEPDLDRGEQRQARAQQRRHGVRCRACGQVVGERLPAVGVPGTSAEPARKAAKSFPGRDSGTTGRRVPVVRAQSRARARRSCWSGPPMSATRPAGRDPASWTSRSATSSTAMGCTGKAGATTTGKRPLGGEHRLDEGVELRRPQDAARQTRLADQALDHDLVPVVAERDVVDPHDGDEHDVSHAGRRGRVEQPAGRVHVALPARAGGQVHHGVSAGDRLGDAVTGEQVPGRQTRPAAPAEGADVVPGRAQAGDGGGAEGAGGAGDQRGRHGGSPFLTHADRAGPRSVTAGARRRPASPG